MFGQNPKSGVSSLIVGALLAATPINSMVSAQEVMTLEMIGAVRMAKPDEVQRPHPWQRRSIAQCQDPQTFRGAQTISALTC